MASGQPKVGTREAKGSVSFQVVWLSSPCSCSNASRLCSVQTAPQLLPSPQLTIVPLQARRRPMRHLPRRQMTQSFGQRFLAPVTRYPIRRPHNPPRPCPTFRQTARIQQPPRRRKPRRPNVPPILSQQVKRAQLMRRFPAIDQLNARRDGPVPIADQMLRMLHPLLPGQVNHLGPRAKSPQGRSRSSVADYLQFSTSATGSRPQTIQFQRSVRRQLRHGQRRLPQPLANRTFDAAHPVAGAGVAQSLRGQADGDVTVFLENRWWRISSPSNVIPPAIRRHCPQRNTGIWRRTSP